MREDGFRSLFFCLFVAVMAAQIVKVTTLEILGIAAMLWVACHLIVWLYWTVI